MALGLISSWGGGGCSFLLYWEPVAAEISHFTCKNRRDFGGCVCVCVPMRVWDRDTCVITQKRREITVIRGCNFFPFVETEKSCVHLSQFKFILSAFLQVPLCRLASLARGPETSLVGIACKKPSGEYEHWWRGQGLKSRTTRRTKRFNLLNIVDACILNKNYGENEKLYTSLQANYAH